MRTGCIVAAACLVVSCLTASVAEPVPFEPQVVSDPYPGIQWPNAGYDVIGDRRGFDIESITLTQFNDSTVSLDVRFNYGPPRNFSRTGDYGDATLRPYTFAGATLQVGDVLFDVDGEYRYGVALVDHDGFDAGDLYRIERTRDSDFYLGQFRRRLFWNFHTPVRMDPNGSEHLSEGTVVTTNVGGPELQSTITFAQDPDFTADWLDSGLSVHFTSAICANDEINGMIGPTQVPEPGSFVLLAAGVAGLAALRRLRRP
jgi:hypothetical protein